MVVEGDQAKGMIEEETVKLSNMEEFNNKPIRQTVPCNYRPYKKNKTRFSNGKTIVVFISLLATTAVFIAIAWITGHITQHTAEVGLWNIVGLTAFLLVAGLISAFAQPLEEKTTENNNFINHDFVDQPQGQLTGKGTIWTWWD